ncbi:hypothetical protein ACFC06_00480 [Nocardia sp. NPDC056064]|uniref:hypothetical protein n=1 Tax=Nocardia sp. NPDC056064 TaxID=3345701 RepID=UPI0035DFA6E3
MLTITAVNMAASCRRGRDTIVERFISSSVVDTEMIISNALDIISDSSIDCAEIHQ